MTHKITLIGGTGPEGRGLATRFALAGHSILIGSRDRNRAQAAADVVIETLYEKRQSLPNGNKVDVSGDINHSAVAKADIVVITVPYEGQRDILESLRDDLRGKIVVDTVVPVYFDRGARPIEVPSGSATEEAANMLPESRVVGAFHNLSAEALLDSAISIDADVLVTGSDTNAKQMVCDLAEQIEGVRAVDAGPLRFSRFVEGITVLLIGINGRYKTQTHVKVSGIPDPTPHE